MHGEKEERNMKHKKKSSNELISVHLKLWLDMFEIQTIFLTRPVKNDLKVPKYKLEKK